MEELKEHKDLQVVLVKMIITSIATSLYCGNCSTPTHIILDEACYLLRGGATENFIKTAALRLRKYQGSLVVGTQSPHDFFQSPGAQEAFDNSDWACFLSQKPDTLGTLKKSGKLTLTNNLEESIKSLHTVQGSYAEVLIYGPHGYAINRLILDKFSQILFTTTPEEFSFIHTLTQNGVPLAKAIHMKYSYFLLKRYKYNIRYIITLMFSCLSIATKAFLSFALMRARTTLLFVPIKTQEKFVFDGSFSTDYFEQLAPLLSQRFLSFYTDAPSQRTQIFSLLHRFSAPYIQKHSGILCANAHHLYATKQRTCTRRC